MKKLFSLFAAVTLSVGLWALDNVPYVDMEVSTDAEGHVTVTPVAKTANNVTVITNQSDLFTLEAGWYVVNGADIQTSTLICNGAVHLILADGAKLTATGQSNEYGLRGDPDREGYAGIQVSDEAYSLTIYGQTDQSGQLIATGGWQSAGIGGGYGNGYNSYGSNGYNITINGGTVTATSGYKIFGHGDSSAGIGGGNINGCLTGECGGYGINITINAGKVTAISKGRGAGIGAGEVGSALGIVINGGEVTAESGLGSGIGNGHGLPASDITINGGTVTATGKYRTGIGGNNITINDGTVTANGGIGGDGLIINGGMVTANGGIVGNGNTINDGTVIATGGKGGAGIGGDDITINGGTVTATGGADGGEFGGAGIGSGAEGTVSGITITGGTVIATGGEYAAGIGGGDQGSCSDITISGGTVTAIGGVSGAGIGSGAAWGANIPSASNITISGGLVTAIGGKGEEGEGDGDGIGRGDGANASDIFISASLPILADNDEEPTSFIAHADNEDITGKLASKRFATTQPRVRTNYAADKQAYYSTFYFGGMPLKLESEDVTMYTAALVQSGAETMLGLYEIEGDILPAGTPVVIEAADAEKVHFTPYYGEVEELTISNDLTGVDEETAVSTLGAGTIYTLAAEEVAGDITTAFYKYTGTTVAAHKAYLQLPVGVSAPRRITFGANTATGMENAASEIKAEKILRDGQLLILKNGHLYNVEGALVK